MDDHRLLRAQSRQSLGDLLDPALLVHADELSLGLGGVRQRAQQVEDGRHAQRFARAGREAHRRVVMDRKAEAHADLIEAPRLHLRRGVDVDADRLQDLRRAATGSTPAAVLCDADAPLGIGQCARRGGDDRGSGRDVERLGRAACAASVDERLTRGACIGDVLYVGAHRAGAAHEFLDRCAADLDERQDGPDLGVVELPAEQVQEEGLGLRIGESFACDEACDDAHGHTVAETGPMAPNPRANRVGGRPIYTHRDV